MSNDDMIDREYVAGVNDYHPMAGEGHCTHTQTTPDGEMVCGRTADDELHTDVETLKERLSFRHQMDGFVTGYAQAMVDVYQSMGLILDPVEVSGHANHMAYHLVQNDGWARQMMDGVVRRESHQVAGITPNEKSWPTKYVMLDDDCEEEG